ncbi:PAS domain-containing protein [Lichenicoccus sp.]|uniref:GAF domain-containing hybrid sensor histidine kinase/response regulator n=1 Tax=Lichenicoccus sp. TaxID=2781899 RepID=UPI003D108748
MDRSGPDEASATGARSNRIEASARGFAALVEQSADFIAMASPDGLVDYLNEAGQRLIGLTDPALLYRRRLANLVMHGTGAASGQAFEGHVLPEVQASAVWRGDLGLRRQDAAGAGIAAMVSVSCSVFPLRDAQGRIAGFGMVARDVTQARQVALRMQALVELGDRMRELDDPADMARAAAEIMGRTLEVSRAGYGTIDAVRETITIERDWTLPGTSSLAGTLHFREFGSYIEDLKRGETVVFADAETDARTTVAALERIEARSLVNLPIVEQGRFVALFYLNNKDPRAWTESELGFIREVADRARDAIERRRGQHQLRRLADDLQRLVAQRTADRDRMWRLSSDVMLVVTLEGVIESVNPAWRRVLDWNEPDLLGINCAELIHPDDLAATRTELARLADGRVTQRFENCYRHRDGSYRWLAWTAVPEAGRVHAVGRDVTAERASAEAQRVLEAQLRQSQKMEAVGQLSGGIAHDFNNLLTGITGSLELLGTRLTQGRLEGADRYITAAVGAAGRAASLTHRLLAFSRRQTLDPRPINLNRLIGGMEELVRRTVGPMITVEVVQEGCLWMTLCDPNQLENALLNLCINGRDAMPDGGRLTIETANSRFDVRAARERDLPTGQYVSLCVTDTGTGMEAETAARLPRLGSGETVLVVDDEPTVRMLVTEVLENLGYAVIEAQDGTAGLQVLRSDAQIDLLVTDVGLPGGMNGRQLADAARARRPDLKVLLITGYAENAVIGNGLLAPGMELLTKPFAMSTLGTRIRGMIES